MIDARPETKEARYGLVNPFICAGRLTRMDTHHGPRPLIVPDLCFFQFIPGKDFHSIPIRHLTSPFYQNAASLFKGVKPYLYPPKTTARFHETFII